MYATRYPQTVDSQAMAGTQDNKDLLAYVISLDTPISRLESREAFESLSEKEKHYCHFLSRASWEGAVICLLQTSPESAPIFLLLKELFSSQSIQALREAAADCVSDEEFKVTRMRVGGGWGGASD